jgi:hypothetical protein
MVAAERYAAKRCITGALHGTRCPIPREHAACRVRLPLTGWGQLSSLRGVVLVARPADGSDVPGDPATLWTVGHSTLAIEAFLASLAPNAIEVVADVRRFPGSRRHPQFGAAALERSLHEAGIMYVAFPDLGGRRTSRPDSPHTAWRNASFRGYADYMDTPAFAAAAARLDALARERHTTVMCAEAIWSRCHRALIADAFAAAGWRVLHISASGRVTPHPFTSAAHVIDGHLSYRMDEDRLFPGVCGFGYRIDRGETGR